MPYDIEAKKKSTTLIQNGIRMLLTSLVNLTILRYRPIKL